MTGLLATILRRKSDPDLHEMIDDEYDVLAEDRNTVRTIFPRGDSKAGLRTDFNQCRFNQEHHLVRMILKSLQSVSYHATWIVSFGTLKRFLI